jgi:hypothetical protein
MERMRYEFSSFFCTVVSSTHFSRFHCPLQLTILTLSHAPRAGSVPFAPVALHGVLKSFFILLYNVTHGILAFTPAPRCILSKSFFCYSGASGG